MKDLRPEGIAPELRRLKVGLTSVIGLEDGAVVEVFPDGSDVVLVQLRDSNTESEQRPTKNSQERSK